MAAKGLSDERAAKFMVALREGKTHGMFGTRRRDVEAYCAANPEYAREALPLLEANAKAAYSRKGAHLRDRTHCKHGHSLEGARVYEKDGYKFRFCAECRKVHDAKGGILKPVVAAKIKAALKSPTATIKSIIHAGSGHIVTYVALQAYRRADPEIDALVSGVVASHASRWQRRRRLLVKHDAIREESNDYFKIRAMLPANFPGRDDVVSDIFEALLDGSLRREDVKARVSNYVAAHNRRFPTKFAKFGNSPLVSLDEVLFDDGTATRGDTVSRGLWD
jgi:hypothetical protein